MDRIIFNHVLRGFPADEKFIQIVDQNATSITNVCIALFGKTPTIVCGLNVTKMYKQGVTNVNVDDGFLWTGDDLIPVEGNVFSGIDPDIDLYISTTSTTEQCTFFDGNLYDAYYSNKGTVVNAQLNPPTKYPFRLSTIVRANICQSIVSDIDLADLNNTEKYIQGSLRQTVYSDGQVNICGTFSVFASPIDSELSTKGIKVAQLPFKNTDMDEIIPGGVVPQHYGVVYPALIRANDNFLENIDDEKKISVSHFVKMTKDGSLYAYIPVELFKIPFPPDKPPTAVFYFVSVDFTYNSRK